MASNTIYKHPNSGQIMTKYTCPWCQTFTHAIATIHQGNWPGTGADGHPIAAHACCGSCGTPALIRAKIVGNHASTPAEATIYPASYAKYDEEGVPVNIARDFTEALNCAQHGYKLGAALVARRVLQMVAREVSGVNGNLVEEINAMSSDLVPKVLKDAAHQVRYIGNDAAHADEVTADDVTDLINFTTQILHAVYVMPAKVKATQERRK